MSMSATISNRAVQVAARWLASQKRPPEPIILQLRIHFGLTTELAEEAIREAKLIHVRAM